MGVSRKNIMIIIDSILIDDSVVEEKFECELNACKGACCWEGDYGAPLEREEIEILENIRETLRPYLSKESNEIIDEETGIKYFDTPKFFGTNLHENGACVYLTYQDGIALCGIEKAWKDGKIEFQKPISCHLYPIRVDHDYSNGFDVMQYDVWDICSAACHKGVKQNVRVYEFAKDAIIRKYGKEFYNQLEEAQKQH